VFVAGRRGLQSDGGSGYNTYARRMARKTRRLHVPGYRSIEIDDQWNEGPNEVRDRWYKVCVSREFGSMTIISLHYVHFVLARAIVEK